MGEEYVDGRNLGPDPGSPAFTQGRDPTITCGSSVPLVVSLFRITSNILPPTRSGLAVVYISHVLERGARAGCLERCALHCSLAFIIINNGEASELGT